MFVTLNSFQGQDDNQEIMKLIAIKPLHLIKKAFRLGPKRTLALAQNKLRAKIFSVYWRNKALSKNAHHTWDVIAARYHFSSSFGDFFIKLQSRSMPIVNYLALDVPREKLIMLADNYVEKRFDILGSGLQHFTTMPWHEDFRLKAQDQTADSYFPADTFYQDIEIHIGESEQLIKDIKVPWELSRFQHLLVLGQAYEKAGNHKYVQACAEHIQDWIEHNPFMLGTNWVCPMEVGLRSIHWILAFEYFKKADLPESFWRQFVCTLYDHLFYLENNWEVYDGVTSNHYLSDLVGYLYLCLFFKDLSGMEAKRVWCFAQILQECEKQVFEEGTSYEGSTAYHRLVTELFMHAYVLARDQELTKPILFEQKLGRMLEFIEWCTPQGGSLVTIGDHDSGCVTHAGITKLMRDLFQTQEIAERKGFPSFGLSVIKNNIWHVTLRHHTYQARQPSGHFHNDVGSITLAVNGIPLFIDPGSYLYTPSRIWRNHFRSASVHNTMFVQNHEPIPFDERLFALSLSEKNYEMVEFEDCRLISHNELYSRFDVSLTREVKLCENEQTLIIQDKVGYGRNFSDNLLIWNFTLSPEIQAIEKDQKVLFLHEGKILATMFSSSLQFKIFPSWDSLDYGKKVASFCLQASLREMNDLIHEIRIHLHA